MESSNQSMAAKFTGLLFYLKKSRKEFEVVADEIGDGSLRSALNGISTDSSYFSVEIQQQLLTFGVEHSNPDEYIVSDDLAGDTELEHAPGMELLHICAHNEHFLLKAYNDLIAASIPYQSLKEIMICQLEALKYAFLKIRTLNTARFVTYAGV